MKLGYFKKMLEKVRNARQVGTDVQQFSEGNIFKRLANKFIGKKIVSKLWF
jgi:hypothetical protein